MFSNVVVKSVSSCDVSRVPCTAHKTHRLPDDGPGGPKRVGAIRRRSNCIV